MSFYRFVPLGGADRLTALQRELESVAGGLALKGTVLLAAEGINGTVSGERAGLLALRDHLRGLAPFAGLDCRFSSAGEQNPVFHRLKIRIKDEIVRLDQGELAVHQRTGEHVDAARWNELLDDPDVVVLDTRNGYEIAIGSFPGARNPDTRSFRQFPDYVEQHLDPARHRRIAMFCTGGIRCEKASAWMLSRGFESVYQLDGGILGYLATVTPEGNRWHGECFVFDQRVSVDNDLSEGRFEQCFACRRPLSPDDLASDAYQPGVSCPHCVDTQTERQRAAFQERRRQELLAAGRGQRHVGATMAALRNRDPD